LNSRLHHRQICHCDPSLASPSPPALSFGLLSSPSTFQLSDLATFQRSSLISFPCHTSEKSPANSNHCHSSKNTLPQVLCLPHIQAPPPGCPLPLSRSSSASLSGIRTIDPHTGSDSASDSDSVPPSRPIPRRYRHESCLSAKWLQSRVALGQAMRLKGGDRWG